MGLGPPGGWGSGLGLLAATAVGVIALGALRGRQANAEIDRLNAAVPG